MQHTHSLALPGLLVCLVSSALAAPQDLNPVVAASIHDEPRDGIGDSFNNPPFTGLLRELSSSEDRAIQEFDVAALIGSSITSATLSGTISVNNAFDNGLRSFDFLVYEGNGLADLSDFEIAATLVGSGSYQPPTDTSFDYSFDVTAVVQSLLDGGAAFVGLKVDCTSDPNFPNILVEGGSLLSVQTGMGLGTSYCISVPNSTGGAAVISAGGSASVAANDLVLAASPVPAGQNGVFFYGPDQVQLPFGNGFRCVAGGTTGIARLPVTAASPGQVLTWAVDNAAPPTPATQITGGSTWNFQAWFRDPAGGGAAFNLSDGLSLTFAP